MSPAGVSWRALSRLSCTAITNCLPPSCCRMHKASSSSPKGSWGSTSRSVGETLVAPPDLSPIWKVILTLTCGLVTGLMICGVVGWEDCAWTLLSGGRASLQENKVIDSEAWECRSWRARAGCRGTMDSELLPFSVNMSVLLLLWLWSLVLGWLFSSRHSCSGAATFIDIGRVSWK